METTAGGTANRKQGAPPRQRPPESRQSPPGGLSEVCWRAPGEPTEGLPEPPLRPPEADSFGHRCVNMLKIRVVPSFCPLAGVGPTGLEFYAICEKKTGKNVSINKHASHFYHSETIADILGHGQVCLWNIGKPGRDTICRRYRSSLPFPCCVLHI